MSRAPNYILVHNTYFDTKEFHLWLITDKKRHRQRDYGCYANSTFLSLIIKITSNTIPRTGEHEASAAKVAAKTTHDHPSITHS